MFQLVVHHAEDPNLFASIEQAAADSALSGRPISVALTMAGDRLRDGWAVERMAIDGSAATKLFDDRFRKLNSSVLQSIGTGLERGLTNRLNGMTAEKKDESGRAELEGIMRINAAANSTLDLEQTSYLAAKTVADVMELDECSVWILDDESNRLILHQTHGLNTDLVGKASMQVGEGIAGSAAELGESVVVRDAWADPRFRVFPGLGEEQYCSILAVPIVQFTANRLLGVLSMHSREYRDFSGAEIEFVETAAGQLAMALWNANLYEQTDEELRRRYSELTTLQRIGQSLTSNLNYRDVLEQITSYATSIIEADKAAIFEVDNDRIFIVAHHNVGPAYRQLSMRVGEGVAGEVVKSHQPAIVIDALTDRRLMASPEMIREEGYSSMLCVPLKSRGRVLGAITIYSESRREFGDHDVQLVSSFADQAAIAMSNARLYAQANDGMERNSLLLRELHHRVKNNLQTVASLLNMQSRRTESPEAGDILALSAGRITGMAAVHDLLSGDRINVATATDIVSTMADIARSDIVAMGKNIAISVEGQIVDIPEDKATTFALVINELIWNAIDHGFSDKSEGKIVVTTSFQDGDLLVEVRDDGRGLPANFDLGVNAGLGLSIVNQLVVRDLKGKFQIAGFDGVVASVTFSP
tara:strand:- start:271 stop:2202 length:1932 start_codon:yes stop_codon:yes gene_type:complete